MVTHHAEEVGRATPLDLEQRALCVELRPDQREQAAGVRPEGNARVNGCLGHLGSGGEHGPDAGVIRQPWGQQLL